MNWQHAVLLKTRAVQFQSVAYCPQRASRWTTTTIRLLSSVCAATPLQQSVDYTPPSLDRRRCTTPKICLRAAEGQPKGPFGQEDEQDLGKRVVDVGEDTLLQVPPYPGPIKEHQ